MINLNKLKLKTLLAGAMTAALFLTISISSYINISGFSSMFYTVTEKEHLPNVVERAKAQIESELKTPISLSESFAKNYFAQQWVVAGENPAQLPDMLAYMSSFIDGYGASAVFWVSKDSKNYYTQDGLFKQVSESVSRDGWFFSFLKSGQPLALNLDPNETTGILTVYVNVLAKTPSGQVLGVAGLGYDVSAIIKFVEGIKVGEYGYMLLVDGEGNIVAHRDKAVLNQSINSVQQYSEIASSITTASKAYVLRDGEIDGEPVYIATIGLNGLDWKLVTVLPKSEISGKVNSVTWFSIAASVVLAIVFILLSVFIATSVSQNISQVGDKLLDMSASGGDLTHRLNDKYNTELGYLAGGFNAILSKFSDLVKEIIAAESAINRGVDKLKHSSEESVKHSDEQRRQTEVVASAITELGQTISEVSSVAHSTAEDTNNAVSDTHETSDVMQNLSKTMDELAESMKQSEASISDLATQAEAISMVVDVISSISEQTNLLALNAAIEAARAGEQGRGFAVVADEVRTLASRTQDSTNEIRAQIEQLQRATSASLSSIKEGAQSSLILAESAKEASSSLDAIRGRFDSISDGNHQVAAATEQQSTVVEHVSESAQNISLMANHISDAAMSQIEEVNGLSERARHMREIINQFKV
ncbi:methyl-accepting chemotaxis protein [Thalassotalea sediminis]|uniref:methyl-accepting chemotaxis protein n=1 Tax=Thalassotalea sediminis TaxID=1759089 RepID=UPI002573B3A0|nr:methyl-accepting chemotaxis protein [Thalassotalea sediminis]